MKKSNLLVALVGMALFTWVIAHMGLPAILQQLKSLRVALPILLAFSICRLLLQTASWSYALKTEGIAVAPTELMGTRLASQSMGYLTVLGPVLSEPMKINLLRTPAAQTINATFLDDGVYWFTSALWLMAGCVCAGLVLAHGAALTWVLALSTVLSFVLVLIARRKSILSSLVKVLGRRSPSWLYRAEKIESSIREYRVQQPDLVRRMFWIDLGCQILIAAEVAVVLWSLRLPFHLVTVLAIESLTRAVKMVSGWIPARLGADESGAMSSFMAAGLAPVSGLTLALTRRTRDLLWSLLGLAWLAWKSRASEKPENNRQEPEMEGRLLCRSLS